MDEQTHSNALAVRKAAPLEGQAPLLYRGLRVLTTELAAKAFGDDPKKLQDNYANNRERFEEGKHLFKVVGAELRAIKNQPDFIGLVGSKAPHLVLWTERGIARHAKILETETAWFIFEELEDTYFRVREEKKAERVTAARRTKPQELRLTHGYFMKVLTASGVDHNSAMISTNRIVEKMTGIDVLGELGMKSLPAPSNEGYQPPTTYAAEIGIKPNEVNPLLTRHEYQAAHRDRRNKLYYVLTKKGEEAGGRAIDSSKRHDDGRIIPQIVWPQSIVDRLRADILAGAN